MQIFVRRSDIASAEPDPYRIALNQHGGVADDFVVPALGSGERPRQLRPVDSIGRPGKSEPAVLFAVTAAIQHPVLALKLPDGGLAEPFFVERAVRTEVQNRIGAKLRPADSIGRAGEA